MTREHFTAASGDEIIRNENGDVFYRRDGVPHRDFGPSTEAADGTKIWCVNGKTHRIGGPAVEQPNGFNAYYENGQLHRTDGPAVEDPDGPDQWYFRGQLIAWREDQAAEASIKVEAMGFVERYGGSLEWAIEQTRLDRARDTESARTLSL